MKEEKTYPYLKEVAFKLAGQHKPTSKWLTKKQTAWLEGACLESGIPYGKKSMYGSAFQGHCRAYAGPNFDLTISPLNQCGSFKYHGSDEYMEGEKKELIKKLGQLLKEAKEDMKEAGDALIEWSEWKKSDKNNLPEKETERIQGIMDENFSQKLKRIEAIQSQFSLI